MLNEMSYEKIEVKSLTERAKLKRKTFFFAFHHMTDEKKQLVRLLAVFGEILGFWGKYRHTVTCEQVAEMTILLLEEGINGWDLP